jgi:hypothetical protein
MSAPNPRASSSEFKESDWDDSKHFTQWLYCRLASNEKGPWHKDEVGKKTTRPREEVARFRTHMEYSPEAIQAPVGALLDEMDTLLTLSKQSVESHRSLGQKGNALDLMRGVFLED